MDTAPTAAATLLQAGLLLTVALVARSLVARHLPIDTVPVVLRSRVELSSRVCPWLLGLALALVATGLFLLLLG